MTTPSLAFPFNSTTPSPTKAPSFHKLIFALAFFFRFIIFGIGFAILHDSLSISTTLETVLIALGVALAGGTLVAFSSLKGFVAPVTIVAGFLLINLGFWVAQSFFANTPAGILKPYSALLDFNLLFAVIFFGYITTWSFWRVRFYSTLEMLVILLLLLTFFSPHRDFQFALAPEIVHSLAWELRTSSFALLIILGGATTLITSVYLGLSHHAGIPGRGSREAGDIFVSGRNRPLLGTIIVGCIVLIVSFVSRQVYSHYQEVQESVGANGVGFEEDKEALGKSPLGFHSALGSNKQPSALVRLGGDYQENPTSPMLYMREGALSSFNGTELVNAGRGLDDDIASTSPSKVFQSEERLEYYHRVPVVQSVYLLTEHDVVFTIDYPLSIQPLVNPAQQRFRGAYKVYSVAPTYQMEDLSTATPGHPDWPPEKLEHYLVQHSDNRYSKLANEIVGDSLNPAKRAVGLVEYLNKNAIYTLTPKHEVEKDEDPVAPFLFGDMRGYCVHFAHATVYMLRALGIPARIATGYLTDLSQARDGHILLRMTDRHAWAEAYFEGHGWVPFDTQPEQVENHADTEVNMELLEELMGLLGPENTLLPEEPFEEEPGLQEPIQYELPSTIFLLKLGGVILILMYLWKLLLWYGWLLPGSTEKKAVRAYRAIQVRLADLGHPRQFAETIREYLLRLRKNEGILPNNTWETFRHLKYAAVSPSVSQIHEAARMDLKTLSKTSLLRRGLAFLNPLSMLRGD